MKKLQILKAVLDLIWFFSIVIEIVMIVSLILHLFNTNIHFHITIMQNMATDTISSKIFLTISILSTLLFIYSIYLLRKVVVLFQKGEIFNDKVICSFDLIGKLNILYTIINIVSLFIYILVTESKIDFSLNFSSNNSFLISISIGLFFMVISEIFKIAKNMKEDSDLMI